VLVADVADPEAMDEVARGVAELFGAADIVVNNAGIALAGSFFDTRLDDWRRVLDVNLWGVIHGCLLLGGQMVDRGQGGQIVNVASAAAFQPSRAMAAYCTSKSAVLMLSECLRAELAGYGIGVTAICPGIIDTPITRSATYVGRTEDDQDAVRERVAGLYARRHYTAGQVADRILAAVLQDRAVVPVSPEASAMHALSRLAPGVLRRLARIDPLPG
jgi:NAD(P)-dependent dehydrogenase (short-subunit alcohol dehydrogenase family)